MLYDATGKLPETADDLGQGNDHAKTDFYSTEELMYFFRAPLSHVALYETELRLKRLRRDYGRGLPLHCPGFAAAADFSAPLARAELTPTQSRAA